VQTVDIKGIGKAQFPDDMSRDNMRDFLRSKFSQPSVMSENVQDALTPIANKVEPTTPTFIENVGQNVSDALFDSGIVSDRFGAQRIGGNIASIGEFLPVIGDAAAGDDFGRAAATGDLLGAGLAAAGTIPIAGDLLNKVAKLKIDVDLATKNYNTQYDPLKIEFTNATKERKEEIIKTGKELRKPLLESQNKLLATEREVRQQSRVRSVDNGNIGQINSGQGENLVTLYHGTSNKGIKAIKKDGVINGPVFLTPRKDVAESYSESGNVIEVRVPAADLQVDFDLAGAKTLSFQDALSYSGQDWETINDAIDQGQSVATMSSIRL